MAWVNFEQVITVDRITKNGVYAAGKWFNLSKDLLEAGYTTAHFPVGQSFVIKGFKGVTKPYAAYIKEFTAHAPAAGAPPVPAQTPPPVAPPPPPAAPPAPPTPPTPPAAPPPPVATAGKAAPMAYGRVLSDYELRKDNGMKVSGLLQALIQSPTAPIVAATPQAYITAVEDRMRELLALADKLVDERVGK